MISIFERIADLVAHRRMERLQADMFQQQAKTDYIAMMVDVDIPVEEGGEEYVV